MLNEGAYKASQEQRKGHNTLTIGSTLAEKNKMNLTNEELIQRFTSLNANNQAEQEELNLPQETYTRQNWDHVVVAKVIIN
jgi:hypothetical protein